MVVEQLLCEAIVQAFMAANSRPTGAVGQGDRGRYRPEVF